mgnify:CR=1 FL=1|jgi:DNA invertase Pin-like site-specific DNA recombinase
MANVAYVRVSTVEQNQGRQVAALKPHQIDKWYIDKCSGKNTDRPQFQAMLDYIRDGDTVFVEDFSRLSRSVADLLHITADFQRRKIGLVSLKERLDSSTPQGRLMLTMIAAINEFERANILERQAEGIALAKQKGAYKGRKRIQKPDNWQDVYGRWKQREISGAQAMQELDLKRNTFYNFVRLENVAEAENNN